MNGVSGMEFWTPVLLSVKVALLAAVLATAAGVWAAARIGRRPFRGRTLVETVLMLPLVLPPTVVGFLLLVLLGRRSPAGRLIEWLSGQPVIFTPAAAVIASLVVSFPLVYQTMKTGFLGIDRRLEEAARNAGAGEWQVFRYITLPLAAPSLLTAFMLGFARSIGEFGATLMIAGNIPGRTQTVPTAIYVAVDAGHMRLAWLWTGAIVLLSFVLLLFTGRRRRG